jgi:TPR repeat protein
VERCIRCGRQLQGESACPGCGFARADSVGRRHEIPRRFQAASKAAGFAGGAVYAPGTLHRPRIWIGIGVVISISVALGVVIVGRPPREFGTPELRDLWKRAHRGDALAQRDLGLRYDSGDGIPKDATKAVGWWRKAAEQGDALAQFKAGTAFAKGEGVPKDSISAVTWWRKAADQGNAHAQFNLGSAYARGEGVAKDPSKATEFWRKAAEQGNDRAQAALGLAYSRGDGVPKDVAIAVDWWRKAAGQGNTRAQTNLGLAYSRGRGVEKDSAAAVDWWRKAAEQGNARAQASLGLAYRTGDGVPRDLVKAIEWLRKAAEQGNALAQVDLGFAYSLGVGVSQDPAAAMDWWRKAGEQGNTKAQIMLALAYAQGDGVPKDVAKAVTWYRRAAEQGEAVAQANLGWSYAKGEGVPSDRVQAYMWLNLAAARGNETAAQWRDSLQQHMSAEEIREAQRLAREWKPRPDAPIADEDRPSGERSTLSKRSVATAFYVSRQGQLLTNYHVVEQCGEVRLAGRDEALKVVAVDAANDLALLVSGDSAPREIAVFRSSLSVEQGESVFAYGFPLQGALSPGGTVSSGMVNALSGLANNSNQIQVSMPIQPGNSGGPVLDRKGQVVGVVTMKLDAVKVAQATGTMSENVSFAVNLTTTRNFLDVNRVTYLRTGWFSRSKTAEDIAAEARGYTVLAECWK